MTRNCVSAWLLICLIATALGQDNREKQRRLRELAAKPDGLHEAAKYGGGAYRVILPSSALVRYRTLASIARHSDVVLIGRAETNVCKLTDNGRAVVTEFAVRAEDVLQGAVHPGSVVPVRILGGRFTFGDGSMAQQDYPDLQPLQDGTRYLLYLKYDPVEQAFYPTGGDGQGVFELKSDGNKVHSHANRRLDPLATKSEQSQPDLLREARATAKKQAE